MKDEKYMHITTQRISSHLGYRSHQLSFVFLLLCATNRNLEMLQVFLELSRDLSASQHFFSQFLIRPRINRQEIKDQTNIELIFINSKLLQIGS